MEPLQYNRNGVNYIVQGQGPPVILVHGIGASLQDWRYVAPQLAASGYSVYALDLLGHGESAKPDDPRHYHVEALYAHFARWLDEINPPWPVPFAGHSLGGHLSLLYALRHPERVRGLILINPFYSPRQLSPLLRLVSRRPHLGEKAMRLTPQWLIYALAGWDADTAASRHAQARQQIAQDYKRASPYFVYIAREVPDLTPRLSAIDAPTLVIWGQRDLSLRPSSFPPLLQALPRARGHAIPNCGHQPHIGKPEIVGRVMIEFISQLNVPHPSQPRAEGESLTGFKSHPQTSISSGQA